MDTPARPTAVPAAAEWIAEWTEWGEGRTVDGVREGRWRFWREDGTFAEESELLAGVLHGEKRRYHDDGSLASTARWEHGVQRNLTMWRSPNPTREENATALPDVIRELSFTYPEAGWIDTQRFFTADRTEVDYRGVPIPPRPPTVAPTAYFANEEGTWVAGEWQVGTSVARDTRRYWDRDGLLLRVEYYRDGKCLTVADRRSILDRGNPLIDAARDGNTRAVGQLLDVGCGHSPGVVLHAAHEQLPDLARSLLAGAPGEPVLPDLRRPPIRDEDVDPAAVWVPGLSSWVLGTVDDQGRAVGTWKRWWSPYENAMGGDTPTPGEDRPLPTSFCSLYETDWVDGRRRALRDFHLAGPKLDKAWVYDADGNETIRRDYDDDGVLVRERETRPDGTEVSRRFHPSGAIRMEQADDAESWWTADGTLAGTVRPAPDLVDEDGDRLAWFTALAPDGTIIAEGPVAVGGGGPTGDWQVDGQTVSFASVSLARSEDLGELARSVARWSSHPDSPALAGVDDVDWSELETFFGDADTFPFLIRGLAVPDRRAFVTALHSLWDPILHQGTISDAAAPVLRYAAALLPEIVDPTSRSDLMEWFVRITTREGSLGAAFRLKQVRIHRPADADPAEHFSEHDAEPAFAAVLDAMTAAVPTWEAAARGSDAGRQWATILLGVADDPHAAAVLCELTAYPEPVIRAEALLALALHPSAPALPAALDRALTDLDPTVRFCAALTRIRTAGTPLDPAVACVLAVLGGGEVPLHGALFLSAGLPLTDAVGALSMLPPDHVTALVPRLGQCIDEVDSLGAVSVTAALLDVVFPRRAWDGETPLDEAQRTAVTAIANSEQAWRLNVNLFEVLRNNGLPTDRAALRSLAAGSA